jgi:TrmH family RNA methyltransferase
MDRLPPYDRKLLEWARRRREMLDGSGIMLEGAKLASEALASGLKCERAWVTAGFLSVEEKLITRLEVAGCTIQGVGDSLMSQISDLETPPGLVVAAHQPRHRLCKSEDGWKFIVALLGAQDPGNVGGVIRTADYFGVNEVWLDQSSADPYAPKMVRGSMGAILRMPVYRGRLEERLHAFAKAGAEVWGSVAHGKAESIIADSPKRILLLGSESRGLQESEKRLATRLVRIPSRGKSESLNLGVAAGILIYGAMMRSV